MLKKLQLKSWFLLLAVLLGGGSAWADPITFELSGTNAVAVESVSSTPVTITFGKGTNTSNAPTWYDKGSALRFYAGNTITIESSAEKITKIEITNTESQLVGGDNGANYPSNGTYSVSDKVETWTATDAVESIVISITNKPRVTKIVVYLEEGSASNLDDCDLALTGAPVALSFDLYNNATAQVINYTTSSTGAVTIVDNDYATFVIDETNKTITVTPTAVTPSAQTITVRQADDENYKAGSVTFTVTITDSTPMTGSWVLTDITDITEGDVFVIVGVGDNAYAMSNDNGTSSAPTAVAVTIENEIITSEVADNITWNISGNATDGYTFYPNGDTEAWLYCNTTANSSSNNNMRVGTGNRKVFAYTNDNYLVTSDDYVERYLSIYNNSDWRGYLNTNLAPSISFYKYVDNSGVQTPRISADAVDLAYDATSGSIAFTLTNPVDGGVMTASTTDTWITLGAVGETVSFTCSANEANTTRTATVTLTYSYGDNETATKDVTITQAAAPVIYSTIPALFAAATSTETEVSVTFDNWVVSGVSTNGKNIYVTDNEGNGFVIYYNSDMSETYSAGKILSGTAVTCTLKKYNGFAELVNVDVTALTISDGGTVTEATVAMADLSGVNTGALVSYENLTCSVENSKYYLSDGTTTLQVYNALYAFDALEEGKTYNIKGIYQQYNNTKEILPRSADDVVEVVSTVSSITVNPSTVDVNAGEHDGTLAITYANLTITDMSDFEVQYYNEEREEASEPEWIEVTVAAQDPQVGEGYVVSYYVIENDGEARSAYFKVYAMDDETNLVYSNLITVNQAAYVPTTNYTLATTLVPGKHYVIASGTDGDVYAMGKMKSTNREAVKVTAVDGVIALTGEEGAYEFLIQGPDKNGNYTIYDESDESTGYLYAAGGTGSNHLKVQTTKDSNAEWSISIDGEGVATIKAKMNGNSGERNWMRFNNGSSKLFSCYSSGQQNIYLFERDGEAAPTEETIAISDVKYATYCTKNALDFTGTGVTAYIAKMEGNTVIFTPVTKVPAYEGVLLKADAAGDFTVGTATSYAPGVWNNAFIGVTEATKVTETGIFVLMNGDEGVGFYKTTQAFTVGAHTAYLPALAGGSDGARSFIGFDFDNTTTGVNGIAAETMANGAVYNLQGQRISESVIRNSELKSGLYIVNGKKVMVK